MWDVTTGVPLVREVAVSSAFPGIEPPVTVDGRRYLDGALRAGTNTDLAGDARAVVVVDPLAHRHPHPTSDGARLLAPDPAAARLLDAEQNGPEAWKAAYQAGKVQAGAAAEKVRAHWQPAPAHGASHAGTVDARLLHPPGVDMKAPYGLTGHPPGSGTTSRTPMGPVEANVTWRPGRRRRWRAWRRWWWCCCW
ncbi:patatin-like phospholipase family protein [Streptomyces anandii]|uniref:patatin-like phospholipase family protein n=1 Tax=Streptomyces anandii TaxID=285454 RepID=UPI0036F5F3E8